MYAQCVAALGEPPRALAGLFAAIGRVVAEVPPRAHIHGMMVGCTAAAFAGGRVRGAHVGTGRALLLRAGADAFESLVIEHYLHLVADRLEPPLGVGIDAIPRNIVCNGLGGLAALKVGIDGFTVELAAGDLLLLCSGRLDVPEDEAACILRDGLRAGAPVEALARALERRAAATSADRASDVAFALALARPAA